jgi:hypothetical protein
MTVHVNDSDILKACQEHISMSQACKSLGLSFSTFKRRAQHLSVYKTNMGGKGIRDEKHIKIEDVILGKHPSLKSSGVKFKL